MVVPAETLPIWMGQITLKGIETERVSVEGGRGRGRANTYNFGGGLTVTVLRANTYNFGGG